MKQAESLQDLLHGLRPRNILVLGPLGERLIDDYRHADPDCELTVIEPDELFDEFDSLPRYDLVFISHTIEKLPKDEAIRLIARLRDIHARRLILLVMMGEGWPNAVSQWHKRDVLALGLVQMAENITNGLPVHIYGYDILTYKTCPDWLNSRFWAHPELFGKHWW